MNWKLIIALSAFGLAMGFASVFGITAGIEGFLWLVIGIFIAVVIALRMPARPFLHGLLIGIIGGLVASFMQVIFFPTYLVNNPESAKQMAQIPGGLDPRFFVLMLAPIISIASGLILGILSWVAAKIVRRNSAIALPQS
jgi:hypothetical protein